MGQLRNRPHQLGYAAERRGLGQGHSCHSGEGVGGVFGAPIDVILEHEYGRGEGQDLR